MTYWPSPAKLNLFLHITGRRNDGYHTLQTLFQLLDYGDTIFIEARNDGKINLLTPIFGVESKDNLIIRAAYLLIREAEKMRRLSTRNGANIYIKKRLPIGSGLGGGSSNAATTLVALNYIWRCGFTENELVGFGLTLGADVSLFIRGYSAFAEGVGDLLSPIQLKEKWYLVVYPGVNVSTSLIFKDPELPRNTKKQTIETLLKRKFNNNCEITVRKRFHKIDVVLSWLLKYAPFRLTGTGSCVFSEFESKFDAYQLLKLIPKWLYAFVARGVNLSPLKKIMLKK